MRGEAQPRGRTVRPLAAAAKMSPQKLLHVVVEIAVRTTGITEAKVSRPPLQIPIQVRDQRGNRLTTQPAAGEFVQRLALLTDRLRRREHVQISARAGAAAVVSKGISQKIQAGSSCLEIDYPRLVPIERQSHPLLQFRFDESAHTRGLISGQYNKVVRIPDQLRVCPLPRSVGTMKHRIEPVQIDIRQQR